MYVSTAYANAHSDLVTGDVATMEQLYPLRNAIGLSLDHASVVELLLGLPPAEAQLEVSLKACNVRTAVSVMQSNLVVCAGGGDRWTP